jgi:hypothetical protein
MTGSFARTAGNFAGPGRLDELCEKIERFFIDVCKRAETTLHLAGAIDTILRVSLRKCRGGCSDLGGWDVLAARICH